jgi:hypothetical protein
MHNNVVLKIGVQWQILRTKFIETVIYGVTNAVLWYVPCLGRGEWYGKCSMLYCDTSIAIRT